AARAGRQQADGATSGSWRPSTTPPAGTSPVARQLSARPPRMRTPPSLSAPVASSQSRLSQFVSLSGLGAEHAAVDGDQRGLLLAGQALVGADGRLHRRCWGPV